MQSHDKLVQVLASLSQEELNALAKLLLTGNSDNLKKFPKLTTFLETHSVVCISGINNKIYKISEIAGAGEPYVLKLEDTGISTSLEEKARGELEQRFANDSVLKAAIAPIYWAHTTKIDKSVFNIQVQPLCRDGTLATVSQKRLYAGEKIEKCLHYFKQVVDFYIALERNRILFSDGKLANFTLDNERLALTDLKNAFDASPFYLANASAINTPTYFLYVLEQPRVLSQVHSLHLGLMLYCFLNGQDPTVFCNFLVSSGRIMDLKPRDSLPFSAMIFKTEIGGLLAILTKALISDDPSLRPKVTDVKKAFEIIEQLILLKKAVEANPNEELKEYLKDVRTYFDRTLQDGGSLTDLLSELQYFAANSASIIENEKLWNELSALSEEKEADPDLKAFVDKAMEEKRDLVAKKLPFSDLVSNLKYRRAHNADIKRANGLLQQLMEKCNKYPNNQDLEGFLLDGLNQFAAKVENRLPLQDVIAQLEVRLHKDNRFSLRRHIEGDRAVRLGDNRHTTFSSNKTDRGSVVPVRQKEIAQPVLKIDS